MKIRSIYSLFRLKKVAIGTNNNCHVVVAVTRNNVTKKNIISLIHSITGISLKKVNYTPSRVSKVVRYSNVTNYVRRGVYLVSKIYNRRQYTLYFSSVVDGNIFLQYFTVIGNINHGVDGDVNDNVSDDINSAVNSDGTVIGDSAG